MTRPIPRIPTRRALAAGLAIATAATLAACSPAAEAGPDAALTWAIDVVPETLNPHINGQTRAKPIFSNVYETLLVKDGDGAYLPALAEGVEVSEDGTVYEFALRDGITFSNGEALDAAAVVLNFEKINDPAYDEQAAGITGVEAVDDATVRITLDRAYSPFLDYAAGRYLVAPASFEADDILTGGADVFGTGPFVIDEVVEGQEITLTRRDDYAWPNGLAEGTGAAALEEVTFRYLPESSVRIGALTSGQADVITGIPAGDVAAIEGAGGLHYDSAENIGTPWALYFNSAVGAAQDATVREAIVLSADVDALVESVYGEHRTRAWSALSAANGTAYETALEGATAPDPARAGQLLDAAGWDSRDADGYRVNAAGERLRVTVYRTESFNADDRGTFLEALQAQLKQANGIDLDLQLVDGGVWYEHFAAADFGGFDISQGGEAGLVFEYSWAPKDQGGVVNVSNATDPELAAWLAEASASTDRATQDAAYRALQSFVVLDRHYVLPLVESQQQLAHRDGIEGLGFLAASGDPAPLYDVRLAD